MSRLEAHERIAVTQAKRETGSKQVQHKGYKIIFQVRLLIRKGLQQIDAFHFQIISRQQVHQ